ncbi:MAG: hypothetical protein JST08_06485 [Actinobacteria bacterium]|nr:hypothetical protein [Actinomycetota bacterium]
MVPDPDDILMRALLAPARALEPTEMEVAGVLARVRPASRRPGASRRAARRRGPLFAGLAALLLLAAGLWSVPATRGALEDAGAGVGGVFSGWLGGDAADAPGRPLRSDEPAPAEPTPTFLYDHRFAKEPRVIAEADGYKLYSYIGTAGGLNFLLGGGIGFGFENLAELGKAPLHVLGPAAMRHADAAGHVPLFGIAARSVKSIELTYESGPPLRVDGVDGGFVLLAEPARGPREVIALDSHGDVLGRQSVDDSPGAKVRIDWQQYLSRGSTKAP